MFTCIACTKQTTDEREEEGVRESSTPSTKEAVKSLTTQVLHSLTHSFSLLIHPQSSSWWKTNKIFTPFRYTHIWRGATTISSPPYMIFDKLFLFIFLNKYRRYVIIWVLHLLILTSYRQKLNSHNYVISWMLLIHSYF